MDLKYLPQRRYQLTLVDDCSRYLAATLLTRRTTAAVCQALPRLLQSFPFRVRCIQTDNGSEFGRELTRLLRRLNICHTRIRPRSPHLNGKVERVQRTVQEELWDGVTPRDPGGLGTPAPGLPPPLQPAPPPQRPGLHHAVSVCSAERLPRARISHVS